MPLMNAFPKRDMLIADKVDVYYYGNKEGLFADLALWSLSFSDLSDMVEEFVLKKVA